MWTGNIMEDVESTIRHEEPLNKNYKWFMNTVTAVRKTTSQSCRITYISGWTVEAQTFMNNENRSCS